MWTHRIEFRKLGEGAAVEDLRDAYSRLMPEDVYACLAFPADTVAHEEVLSVGPT